MIPRIYAAPAVKGLKEKFDWLLFTPLAPGPKYIRLFIFFINTKSTTFKKT